jgi:uncharacterized protein
MALRDQIQTDMITATKARDEVKTNCLRMAISAFKYKESDNKAAGKEGPLDDTDVLAILKTLLKQRKDSLDQFTKANRMDLADKEAREITILEAYLPQQMDDASLAAAVKAAIAETGAAGPKDMGKVIKAVKDKVGGAADGGRISAAVKDQLK